MENNFADITEADEDIKTDQENTETLQDECTERTDQADTDRIEEQYQFEEPTSSVRDDPHIDTNENDEIENLSSQDEEEKLSHITVSELEDKEEDTEQKDENDTDLNLQITENDTVDNYEKIKEITDDQINEKNQEVTETASIDKSSEINETDDINITENNESKEIEDESEIKRNCNETEIELHDKDDVVSENEDVDEDLLEKYDDDEEREDTTDENKENTEKVDNAKEDDKENAVWNEDTLGGKIERSQIDEDEVSKEEKVKEQERGNIREVDDVEAYDDKNIEEKKVEAEIDIENNNKASELVTNDKEKEGDAAEKEDKVGECEEVEEDQMEEGLEGVKEVAIVKHVDKDGLEEKKKDKDNSKSKKAEIKGEEEENQVEKVRLIEDKLGDKASQFITVHVQADDGTVQNRMVLIERRRETKPFLGGYRDKRNGTEYMHAAAQTAPRPRPPPATEMLSRDSQTVRVQPRATNTNNTCSTQMPGVGLYVSQAGNQLLTPKGKYETAEEREHRLLDQVVVIQKYYRRWLARQTVDEKRRQRDRRLQWEQEEAVRKSSEKEDRVQREYERRLHPRTRADFELLYNDLERWRQEELVRIDAMDVSEAEKKAQRSLLLDEETDYLARIDRHKTELHKQGKVLSVQRLLGRAAAPRTWKIRVGRDGGSQKTVELDTPYIVRSRELAEILASLQMQHLTTDERLDVLLTLKHTVSEHASPLTRDIADLVDREADLLVRRQLRDPAVTLAGLRSRITTLFLQYCKTPTFNPQIASLLRVPPDPSVLVGDVNHCKFCGQYLRSTAFALSSKSSKMAVCRSCATLDNQSRSRQDCSHYRRILAELREEETRCQDGSRLVFLFKQDDVRSLLEGVWDSQSVLSCCSDLGQLVLARWDRERAWAPWNTVLLTRPEAEAHGRLINPRLADTYSCTLLNRVYQKHVVARSMFGSLERMLHQVEHQSAASKLPRLPQIKST